MAESQLELLVQDVKQNLATVKAFEDKPYDRRVRAAYAQRYAQRMIKDSKDPKAQGIVQELMGKSQEDFYEKLQAAIAESQKGVIEYSRDNIDSILEGLEPENLVALAADTLEPRVDGELAKAHKEYQKSLETLQEKDIRAMKKYLRTLIADGYEDTFEGMLSDQEAVMRMYAGVVAGRKQILAHNFADKKSIINYAKRNIVAGKPEEAANFYLNAAGSAVEEKRAA